MISNSEYIKKVLLFFVSIAVPTGLAVSIVASWEVGLIFGALSGLFMSFHLGRHLITETFEINATNKDKTKGISWYEDEIIRHMSDLRYHLIINQRQLKVWEPPLRGQVMGGEFKMEVTPYSITITGPRGTVRIIKSILDIKKIFL